MRAKDQQPGERLQKVLARAGVASRRKSEALIESGVVTVNGVKVTRLGTRVLAIDEIRVRGELIDPEPNKVYLLLYKPPRVVTTVSDPEGRATVMDFVPKGAPRVFPVGRLDWASEGLLLLTNDGELANHLMHPRYGVRRVYRVKVRTRLAPNHAKLKRFCSGVRLDDGTEARCVEAVFHSNTETSTWIELTLTEGKNREVRRMCEALKLPVQKLKRISYGPIELTGVKVGQVRELTAHEVQQLRGDSLARGQG